MDMIILTSAARSRNKHFGSLLEKEISKYLPRRKTLLLLLAVLTVFVQIVSAQNEFSGRISVNSLNESTPKIENASIATPSFSSSVELKDKTVDFSAGEAAIKSSETLDRQETDDFKSDFSKVQTDEKYFNLKNDLKKDQPKKLSFKIQSSPVNLKNETEGDPDPIKADGFNWRGAFTQSLMFLGVQHGYAILGQAKTRRALKGKFFKDYVDSVKSLHGWDDGGRFFTNYIAHPMQGSLNGFIYVQNSPQAKREQFSMSGKYWLTRMKAFAWTAAWSTQFELGPISQASIGNVGEKHKQTWEDIVTTPTLGTAMLVTEDAIDRYIIKGIERRTDNYYIRIFSRMILNPTRFFSNLLRFKLPWYRDRPIAH